MKYWDKAWTLVEGCTPCSPGCDHCWSAAMTHRFDHIETGGDNPRKWHCLTNGQSFNGEIIPRPDRLEIPFRRRKPTVYQVWNDLFHASVPDEFRVQAYEVMAKCEQHMFLILTKRASEMVRFWTTEHSKFNTAGNVWHGLTVCNQEEADAKIPIFLRVLGKKFLSIEPMLGPVDIERYLWLVSPSTAGPWRDYTGKIVWYGGGIGGQMISSNPSGYINAVILGGETGIHARPMHPDWARKVRDDCAAAGVPFLLKHLNRKDGRILDGREHNDMPWRT